MSRGGHKVLSVRNNYIFNTLAQVVSIGISFFLMPLLANRIGVEAIGSNAYVFSIVSYFMYASSLGITIYGNKKIASVRADHKKLQKCFSEIFTLQMCSYAIGIIFYIVFVYFTGAMYRPLFFAYILFLIASLLDISWFFLGIENFKFVAIRAISIKTFGFLCIVIFINKPSDLLLYIYILHGTTLVANLFFWLELHNYNLRLAPSLKNVKSHLGESIMLFVPQIAVTVYALADRTMLGLYRPVKEVGIFDYSENIIKITMLFLVSLGSVLLPRISNIYNTEGIVSVRVYISKMLSVTTFFSVGMAWGIAALVKEIIALLMSSSFEGADIVMSILSPIIIVVGCSLWNILIAINRYKYYSLITILGVIVNIGFNVILIPRFGIIGAAIATLATEFTVQIFSFYFGNDLFSSRKLILNLLKYNFSALIMYLIIMRIDCNFLIGNILLKIVGGSIVYIVTCYLVNRSEVRSLWNLIANRNEKIS